MRRLLAVMAAVAVQADAPPPLAGWPPPKPPPANGGAPVVQLNNVGELTKDETLNEELQGARAAIPAEWPATFYSAFGPDPKAPKSCTSSLVSGQVVLTAAHCVADHGQIQFTVAGQLYTGRCRRDPDYDLVPPNISTDYALCLVDKPVVGIKFETLALGDDPAPAGTQILLSGFGCTSMKGDNDGVFRIGEASVKGGPYLPHDNHLRAEGEAVVCFGDSGGPAFLVSAGHRRIVSVNSIAAAGANSTRSYLAATFTPDATAFFRSWQKKMASEVPSADTRICGLDPTAGACR